jgi:hypothetical protein
MMNLFSSKKETPMQTTTGTDVLRAALTARYKKVHVGNFARDLGVGTGALETFCFGNGKLPATVLDALAKVMLGDNVSFDVERDLLVRTQQPATRLPNFHRVAEPGTPPTGADTWRPTRSKTPVVEPVKGRDGWA